MNVAVTGATGHLGGLIIRELHKRNHSVNVLVRGDHSDSFEGLPLKIIKGDLENHNALIDLMNSCDAVIHAAGFISIDGNPKGEVTRTNVDGTRNVMEAAKASGVRRLIHISSVHAYRHKPKLEQLDEHRERVTTGSFAYDHSKRVGEDIALSFVSGSLDVIVINPTSFMGPEDYKPSKIGKFIIDLYTGKLPFLINGGFDFCDARDVASAVVNSLTMGRSGHSYLVSGKWITLKYLSALLSDVSGKNINVIVLPVIAGWLGLPFIYFYGWIKNEEPLYTNEALTAISDGNRNISNVKASKELNYTTRPIEETMKDTYQWFLQNGYLD